MLKDLKRFQAEKEDDLKRYMVMTDQLIIFFNFTKTAIRLPMPNAISTGRRKMLIRGEKPRKRLRGSRRSSSQLRLLD